MAQPTKVARMIAKMVVCRALGIPCRSVTNFASAHDTDESLCIEKYFSDEGKHLPNLSSDSEFPCVERGVACAAGSGASPEVRRLAGDRRHATGDE
ncbi:TGM4-like protein [Mya arenaria]|uniref:TGM4-like protein n=1 Tax=Mya arenaria TaxID=6604 RepID=A0ABY7ESS2_MYAAR|nr:TGM4-like protein [Mya arenaria]